MRKVASNTANLKKSRLCLKSITTDNKRDTASKYGLKDMYFKTVLVFMGAVGIYAQRIHELCHAHGCFDSSNTQLCLTLDGEEVYHADFKRGVLHWESKIPTTFHVPYAYKYAVYYQSICRRDMYKWKQDKSATTKTKQAPEAIIYPKDEVIKDEENTLICFINHFFPPTINIKWTKNDIEVTVKDLFIKSIPNPDGTFHVFSTLDFVPDEGDIYGCTVEHKALEEPQTKFWEVEINETTIGPAVFCGLGLSLGLLGFAAGTFFFVKGKHYQSILVG
ncbi:H-2 class II histocompatibility antigen, A-Q alpha chain-like [Thunnus maccoyii]|uniref:H-2 class II histocompatibility antigen, A-Q alpha chain-like n=1 Tax=Thunnus maccoyii TaxID=8240 RepID=UPI001C4D058F|nr:H-2 class II histocompatibility antigen, A-Q alpha chain-like [Thunnus maccoyii]